MRVVAYCYLECGQSPPSPASWGYPLQQVYLDTWLPAQPSYRPQLAQLIADNQRHPADLLLVLELEALGDNLADIEAHCQTLAAMGSRIVTLNSRPADLTLADNAPLAPGNLKRLTILPDRLRRRQLRRGHARNRLQALPPPGKAPYGYRRGQERYLVDRTTAPVVTAFVNEFLLYGSLRGAVRFVENRFGKHIAVSTGRRWLTHPVYRGDLQYQDGQVIRDTHTAIISREEAAQIDRLLRRNSQLPARTAGAPRSLAGLVYCQACGGCLTITKTTRRGYSQTYLYLRPAHCPRSPRCRTIPYDQALNAIIEQICQDLPQAVAQLQPTAQQVASISPTTKIQGQIQQKQQILQQLPSLVQEGILDGDTAALRRYTLQGEIAQLEQRRAQLPPVNLQELSQSVALPQFWLDLSEAERRFFFREFIRRIKINPHPPDRQERRWQIILEFVF
ncbi:MAG: recombinase family protein [Cyanobacteria bacterium REEB459]|nr:recombinase family protein [Cyanobacteria bacterium REEB459]